MSSDYRLHLIPPSIFSPGGACPWTPYNQNGQRNETTFKKFHDEASKTADEMGIEVSESHPRKNNRRLDDKYQNQDAMVGH